MPPPGYAASLALGGCRCLPSVVRPVVTALVRPTRPAPFPQGRISIHETGAGRRLIRPPHPGRMREGASTAPVPPKLSAERVVTLWLSPALPFAAAPHLASHASPCRIGQGSRDLRRPRRSAISHASGAKCPPVLGHLREGTGGRKRGNQRSSTAKWGHLPAASQLRARSVWLLRRGPFAHQPRPAARAVPNPRLANTIRPLLRDELRSTPAPC